MDMHHFMWQGIKWPQYFKLGMSLEMIQPNAIIIQMKELKKPRS